MLDRATDTNRDIEVRSDDLASLTDLHVVRTIAGINSSTGRANGTVLAAQSGGKIIQETEVLATLETTTTADDKLGACQVCSL